MNIDLHSPKTRFTWFILASLLLHSCLLFCIRFNPIRHSSSPLIPLKLTKIQPAPHIKQIVSPPANTTDDTIDVEHATLLSEKNAFTAKEQIKRGETDAGTVRGAGHTGTALAGSAHSTMAAENTAVKHSGEILMSQNEYFKFVDSRGQIPSATNAKKTPANAPPAEASNKQRDLALKEAQPFTKLSHTPAFSLPVGSPDYLPNIPDGDITLLNTKADKFAVFVRRVALQVFAGIRKRNWQQLSMKEISKLNDFVIIKAHMSPQGEILTASIIESSGSWTFDMLVLAAIEQNGGDKNPPAAAISAVDGNIQFIFKARTWSVIRGAMFQEQRWILLGTGLL